MTKKNKTRTKTSATAELSTPASAGLSLLRLFRDLTLAFEYKQNEGDSQDYAEFDAAEDVANMLSLVRPVTAEEALAQAVFLYKDAAEIFHGVRDGNGNDKEYEALAQQMLRRAFGLAYWIERTHQVDRREFALTGYCCESSAKMIFPHAQAQPEMLEATNDTITR